MGNMQTGASWPETWLKLFTPNITNAGKKAKGCYAVKPLHEGFKGDLIMSLCNIEHRVQ